MAKQYAPLSHASMDVVYECTVAHLWFEEILSGDRHIDLQSIWEHLDQAERYVQLMLDEVASDQGKLLGIYDRELLKATEKVRDGVMSFRAVAEQRWVDRSLSGVGTDIDQRFDAIFQDIIIDTNTVDLTFQKAMKRQLHLFELVESLLITLVIILGVIFSLILYRHDRKRTADMHTLRQSKDEIHRLNRGLESKVAERTRELRVANDHLKDLDHVKSMFIASMSHELRTPLNSIIGFSGMIINDMAGPVSDVQRDYMQRVHRAGKHLLLLITDVIDISKIEAGKIAVVYEHFSLDEMMSEALGSIEASLNEKDLLLKTEIPKSIEMYSDRKRLMQCTLNLLSNAIKYSEHGTVEFHVELMDERLRLSISDNGIGISEQDIPRLFQAFVRFESKLKILNSGTGLGLYLTKKLANEVLGGDITVISKVDKGSTFVLDIPLRVEMATNDIEERT